MISTPQAPRLIRRGREALGHQVADWGYATGWYTVRTMPELFARPMFEAGALYAARGGGPEQLRKNLARVIGVPPHKVPNSLMRASLESYARYWREVFRLPSMNEKKLAKKIENSMRRAELLQAGLDAGRGLICALPHSGNWDMAGVWLIERHGKFTTVAERLKPESLYRRFIDFRETLGFEVVPLTGERPPFEVLAQRLRENKVVCLMADRDLTRTGVQVDFFGEPTRMPAGPAKLAIETGAALLPTYCWNEPDNWAFQVHPPLDTSSRDVGVVTQALADHFARDIAGHPADWHMLQPQWLADLSAERRTHLGQNP